MKFGSVALCVALGLVSLLNQGCDETRRISELKRFTGIIIEETRDYMNNFREKSSWAAKVQEQLALLPDPRILPTGLVAGKFGDMYKEIRGELSVLSEVAGMANVWKKQKVSSKEQVKLAVPKLLSLMPRVARRGRLPTIPILNPKGPEETYEASRMQLQVALILLEDKPQESMEKILKTVRKLRGLRMPELSPEVRIELYTVEMAVMLQEYRGDSLSCAFELLTDGMADIVSRFKIELPSLEEAKNDFEMQGWKKFLLEKAGKGGMEGLF